MQVILLVGDVYLERIPQYAVAAIKLHVEMFGEAITLSGKWSRKSRQIRFQDTIHMVSASVIDGIELTFTLIALQSTEKSDYRVIGSGSVHASLENHSVLQTVMLSSSDMSNLMARLEMKVDFESSQSMSCNTLDDGRSFKSTQRKANGQKTNADSSYQNTIIRESRSGERNSSRYDRDRSNSRSRTIGSRCDKLQSTADGRVDNGHQRRGSDAVIERHQKISDRSRKNLSKDNDNNKRASQKVESKSRRFESVNQVSDRAKHRSEEREYLPRPSQGVNFYNSVQIQTETMKEVEACERLRLALEKKDEMLRRAQSQLNNSVSVRGAEGRSRGDSSFLERPVERADESRSWRNEADEPSLDDRERSYFLREQLGRRAAERATPRPTVALSKSQDKRAVASRSKMINDKQRRIIDREEEERYGVEGVDVSTRSNNISVRLSSSLNASSAELFREAKASLDARDKQIEERRTQEIRNRLQSAEDRRMSALRSHKDRATQMSSEATCKAKAIKEAALMSSRAYDKMRNDFDRKEEMLRRVQDEYRKVGGSGLNQLNRSRDGRLNLSTDGSPLKLVRVTKAGQGEMLRRRASSAPPRARIPPPPVPASATKGRAIPFSNLKRRSRSSGRSESYRARRGALAAGDADSEQFTSQQSSQHVHYIPSVFSSKSAFTPLRTESSNLRSRAPPVLPSNLSVAEPPDTVESSTAGVHSYDRSFQSIPIESEERATELSRSAGSTDGFLDPNLSRKKMARLVHQRVYALKQRIAEVSPAEGESILRMIRNVLPPSSARSRSKHGKKGKRRKRSTVSLASAEQEASHEARGLPYPGGDVDYRDGRGASSHDGAVRNGISDDSGSEGEGEDISEADSVETSTLVSHLWEILGVTAEFGAPLRNPRQHDRAVEHGQDRDLRTYQATSRGKVDDRDSERGRDRSDYRPVLTERDESYLVPVVDMDWKEDSATALKPLDSVLGTPQPHVVPRQRDVQGSPASPPSVLSDLKKPSRYPRYSAESSLLSSEQKEKSKEGRGERWWKTDYLALKGEIKHIIESASPLKPDGTGQTALSGRTKIAIATPHRDSAPPVPLETPPSSSSSSRVWESDPRSSQDNRKLSTAPSKRHVAFSTLDQRVSEGPLQAEAPPLPSTPSSAFSNRQSDKRSAVIPAAPTTSVVDGRTPEHPLRPSSNSTETERAKYFQTSGDRDRPGQGMDPDQYGECSASEEPEPPGDPFAVDTSACISRQIDDVGKAISTLQARIASYMYISPDASPGDGLVTARRAARQAGKDDVGSGSQISLVSGTGSPISEGGRVGATATLGRTRMPEAVGSPESDGRPVYWPLSASGILDDSVVEDREDEGRAVAAAPRESPVSAAGSEAATHAGSAASLNQASDRRSDPLPEGRERDGPKVEREDYFGIKAWQQRYAAGASASEEGPATYMDADSVLATDVPGLRPSHDSAESPAQVAFTHYDTQQQQQSKLGATSSSRSSSSNMFHGLVFSGGTGTGTGANTEDVSVSVRDMDVGNLSYDTLSFAADRMMALGQSSLVDLNNTEDLLKDIFGDDDVDSESEVDEQELPGRVDKSRYPPLTADAERYSDSESNSDDFDGVFGLP